ncbi:MAG: DciA family protein [Methylotenera sp.]
MRKINTLFSGSRLSEDSQLDALTKNVQAHQKLQQLWLAAAPKILSQASFAGSLTNGQLTVYADSAIAAHKIKLTLTSLLTQLQNLQKNEPLFRECKVTAITVKVQVKSRPKPVIKTPRKLSIRAATSLKTLAQDLGDSPLAIKLNALASKG